MSVARALFLLTAACAAWPARAQDEVTVDSHRHAVGLRRDDLHLFRARGVPAGKQRGQEKGSRPHACYQAVEAVKVSAASPFAGTGMSQAKLLLSTRRPAMDSLRTAFSRQKPYWRSVTTLGVARALRTT